MIEAVGVIEVEVGEDDGGDLSDGDLECSQLAVDLLVAGDREFELGVVEPGGEQTIGAKIAGAGDGCAFAGVDEEDAIGVLDDEGPDRQPGGESSIEDEIRDGEETGEAGLTEAGFDGDGAGREEMEVYRTTFGGELDGGGGEHDTSYPEMLTVKVGVPG